MKIMMRMVCRLESSSQCTCNDLSGYDIFALYSVITLANFSTNATVGGSCVSSGRASLETGTMESPFLAENPTLQIRDEIVNGELIDICTGSMASPFVTDATS